MPLTVVSSLHINVAMLAKPDGLRNPTGLADEKMECLSPIYIYIYYTRIHKYANIHTYIQIFIYTYIYIYKHIYILFKHINDVQI